jgi:hypothetical protein
MPHPTPPSNSAPQTPGLSRLQRWGLAALVTAFVLFGFVVEFRSAFLTHHRTDLQVYLRAAWAVRAGADLYTVSDDNDWHYHYPPLFAILMAPLADPPPGAAPMVAIPFTVSVAFWYVLSVGFLAVGVHWLAQVLEETSPDLAVRTQPRGCSRWWALRVLPIVACLPPLWGALARGQVNLLLLALLCGMAAAVLRGRRGQAGLWLAGAICLKVFPVYLLIYPLWRRDGRCLAGCAAGLVVGLGIIPAVVFGPNQTWAYYREWTDVLVRPGLGHGEDHTRDKELIATTATDSQSFLCVLHNTLHLDRATRPRQAASETRLAHWVLGGTLTALTLLALGWRRRGGRQEILGLGTLTLIMFLLSPVCHLHYFCLALPLTMGFLAMGWESPPREGMGLTGRYLGLYLLLGLNGLANTLPHLPGSDLLRDVGLATYGTLLLWLAAVLVLRRRTDTAAHGGSRREEAPDGETCQVAA